MIQHPLWLSRVGTSGHQLGRLCARAGPHTHTPEVNAPSAAARVFARVPRVIMALKEEGWLAINESIRYAGVGGGGRGEGGAGAVNDLNQK